jgi:hypothetical protein
MITKKISGTVLVVCLLGVSMTAFAAKPCEELKSEIDAKFQAKGVQAYTLDIVVNGAEDSGKTVGTCDGGTKHISYKHTNDAHKATMKTEVPAPAAKP